MNKIVRAKLIEIARKGKGYIQYQELSDQCNLGFSYKDFPIHRTEIGDILGEILEFEHKQGRPLLSSLVISASGEEGDGYYKLCEELGYGSFGRLKRDATFAAKQMKRCYDFWQNDKNYLKYKDI